MLAGCGTPRVVVTPSNLNYAQVTYASTNQMVYVMEFRGNGYCTMVKANEAGVTNPFSQTPHNKRELRIEFSPSEMVDIFQALVNTGVFEKEPKKVRAPALPFVGMSGRVENKGFSRLSRTPEFLDLAGKMVDLFEKPEEHRRQLR